ncbi:hypothetical protein F0U60_23210 [Archangium minus]|uniref:Glycerophosphoryl diester phosphodiesterase membrane domain-containing protein n=1 Tax=Archangium minus TaxID=83450 RepID=A0ABY9XAW0_9BACT|nr:hypothetical protein F0U60_23210 [Archangium minus]
MRPVSNLLSDLRPLALGEIIDRAATFWRKHFKQLFLLSLGFNLVSYILTKALQLAMQRKYVTLQDAMRDGDLGVMGAEYGQIMVAMVGLMVMSVWLYSLNTLVVSRYVVSTQLGAPARPAEGVERALRRLGPFTGAYLLSLLWGVGITLVLMVPGGVMAAAGTAMRVMSEGLGSRMGSVLLLVGGILLAGLGFIGGILWYLLRFSLLAPVFALEDLPAVRAFRRSGELLSGRVEPGFTGRVTVRAMILVTVVSLILTAVSILCGLPSLIVQLVFGRPFDPVAAAANPVPQAILVPAELVQVAGQAIFNPLGLVVYATLYLDMRVRREGLDLERRLEARTEPTVSA